MSEEISVTVGQPIRLNDGMNSAIAGILRIGGTSSGLYGAARIEQLEEFYRIANQEASEWKARAERAEAERDQLRAKLSEYIFLAGTALGDIFAQAETIDEAKEIARKAMSTDTDKALALREAKELVYQASEDWLAYQGHHQEEAKMALWMAARQKLAELEGRG